jgi:hypothetical protein
MALQERREFRQFFAEWDDKQGGYMDNVLERANRKCQARKSSAHFKERKVG